MDNHVAQYFSTYPFIQSCFNVELVCAQHELFICLSPWLFEQSNGEKQGVKMTLKRRVISNSSELTVSYS